MQMLLSVPFLLLLTFSSLSPSLHPTLRFLYLFGRELMTHLGTDANLPIILPIKCSHTPQVENTEDSLFRE